LQGTKGPEVGRHIKLYLFQGKNFTPTPVTLEIKIKEVLTPFFGVSTVFGGRSQPGLTDQFG